MELSLLSLKENLKKSLKSNTFYLAVLSSPIQKDETKKISVRPIETKSGLLYQISEQRAEKIFHRNVTASELSIFLFDEKASNFKQAIFFTEDADYQLLRRQKGKETLLKKKPSKGKTLPLHNRQKNYLLPEGEPIDFLIRLGIMNKEGQVFPKKVDKFRQINRYLEIVDDTLSELPNDRELNILDFGCGKSYLTFALYHYLKEIKNVSAKLTGLDLKKDVIDFCNGLAKELGYHKLSFEVGNIEGFAPESSPDMVICLHACDTATDAALENAVRWRAKVILAVPCCQHELFNQVEQPLLSSLLRHGILRERFAALVTDAARADILESLGYHCQIIEFIDLEHTPKNLLIKAIRTKDVQTSLTSDNISSKKILSAKERYQAFSQTLNIRPSLETRFKL
ncbi:MAG: SAM-dependent methyltransferase [Parachlamydiaceae bacterium]|nr:SAM-dependent methyltransferase [Parachlamydiaceae bacterium]